MVKEQSKPPELKLAEAYDYKGKFEKLSLKLYLHTILLFGMMICMIGLVVYAPKTWFLPIYGLGLAIFGAFIIATAFFLLSRLNR